MRNLELASFYSSVEYTVTHRGFTRKIPYREIDYIQSDNKKTIMYLTNGDREVISKNIGKINDEINRKYFKSGAKVLMTEGYFKKFAETYSISVSRLADLKTLDD